MENENTEFGYLEEMDDAELASKFKVALGVAKEQIDTMDQILTMLYARESKYAKP